MFAALVTAVMIAAGVAGGFEAVRLLGAAEPVSPVIALAAWGLCIPFLAGGVWGVRATVQRAPIQAGITRWRGETWSNLAGGIAAFIVSSWLAVRISRIGIRVVQDSLKDPTLLPPLAMVVLLMAGGGAALVGIWSSALFARLWRRMGRRLTGITLLVLGVLCMYSVLRPGWRILFLHQSSLPVWQLLGALALSLALTRWRLRPRWALVGAIGWTLIVAGGLYALPRTPNAAADLAEVEGIGHRVLGAIRWVTDRDKDGFSGWMHPKDCHDSDASLGPNAAEIPGNGVDENCDGEDRIRAFGERAVAHAELPAHLAKPWHILLITIETLRPDHMSVYGYERPTTPVLDELAKNAMVFEHAWSSANRTREAVPAIMLGRSTSQMLVDQAFSPPWVLDQNDTIFERFQRKGWQTHVTISPYLKHHYWYGMLQGVDAVDAPDAPFGEVSAPKQTQAILNRWANAPTDRPQFNWVHYNEPHDPYIKHADFDFGDTELDRYDSEIAFVDAQIGQLLTALKAQGRDQNTIVLITSDHGEAFGDHRQRRHGRTLYEEEVRVPLIVHVPGLPGRRIQAPVTTLDVADTLANLAGLSPSIAPDAQSLVGLMLGETADPRDIWINHILDAGRVDARKLALVRWPFKGIVDFRNQRTQLFDLSVDPHEKTNLARTLKEKTQDFKTTIRERMAGYVQYESTVAISLRRARTPPADLTVKPTRVAPGIEWLGGRITPHPKPGFWTVRNWFRATAGDRGDYQIRVQVNDGRRVIFDKKQRPIGGRLPTQRWQEGDVVEDMRWLHVKGAAPKTARVTVLLDGVAQRKPIEIKPSASPRYKNPSPAPATAPPGPTPLGPIPAAPMSTGPQPKSSASTGKSRPGDD